MAARVFVHFPPLKRVRNRLRVDVSLARLLDRQSVRRAPTLTRERIGDHEQPEID